MPTIHQVKSETPAKVRHAVAPAGFQKPNTLKISQPLFSEKVKERAVKTKKTGRRGVADDELYQRLHQLGQSQLRRVGLAPDQHNPNEFAVLSNADVTSGTQSHQRNLVIGKAKTPAAGTKVKTSYDYSS